MRSCGLVILLAISLTSCVHEPFNSVADQPDIELIWHKSYSSETRNDIDTGMLWALSFLGAEWPAGSYNKTVVWLKDNRAELHLDQAGFNPSAAAALSEIILAAKSSEEYNVHGAFDLGRFVALCLLSSPNYYAITGVPKKLDDFLAGSTILNDSAAAIRKSTVSKVDRLVHMTDTNEEVNRAKFVAKEGTLDSVSSYFELEEFEVMDIMSNGQLRFAVYNKLGDLLNGSDSIYSNGGKPSKCLWCHETNINRNFIPHASHPAFVSVDEFNVRVGKWQENLLLFRSTLQTDVEFDQRQNHTFTELLYIGFMEPSADRLASEWGMEKIEVETLLSSIPKHDHDEFNFMTDLYHRRDVEDFAPFKSLRVSDDARELTNFEADLIP